MFYRILRPFVRFATRRFFREVAISGADPVEEGPLIVVANHPNVMLDGLLVLVSFHRVFWFLAKATIFRGAWVNWLLRWCHMVPVHRRQDNPDTSQNKDSFRQVCDKLFEGAAILIFPEGKSLATRHVLPVKTGTARIAFQAEEEKNFTLGLKIQPVGITYSDFYRFNSSVTVLRGEPIVVADFKEAYEKDPAEAVRIVSEKIERRLKRLIAEVSNPDDAGLVEKIAKLYRSQGLEGDDYARLRAVAHHVEKLGPKFPQRKKQFERWLNLYLKLSSSLLLDGSEGLDAKVNPLLLLLASPFILLGFAAHYVPFFLSKIVSKRAALHRSQFASYGISAGFLLFAIFYCLYFTLGYYWLGSVRWAFGVLALLVVSGYVASRNFHQMMLFLFSVFWPASRSPVEILQGMRDTLIDELESIRTAGD